MNKNQQREARGLLQVLILSHGDFALELLKTAEMILGKQPTEVSALALPHGQDMDSYKQLLRERMMRADDDGILLLADIMGGSPFMTAAKLYEELSAQIGIEMVTGVNLPMVIEVLSARGWATLTEAKDIAMTEGSGGVKDFVAKLKQKSKGVRA